MRGHNISSRLELLYRESKNASDYSKKYVACVADVLHSLDFDAISNVISLLLRSRENGNQVFLVGNVGSAATASHLCNDLRMGLPSSQKPFKSICLTDNISTVTAVGNDFVMTTC